MNSLEYFATLPDEAGARARKDELEGICAILQAGENSRGHSRIELQVGDGDEMRTIDLGDNAKVTLSFPNPKEVLIFSMGCLADDDSGMIPGVVNDEFHFDRRFEEFGDHVLLIGNAPKFSERLNLAIGRDSRIYSTPLLFNGYGLLEYFPPDDKSFVKGLFRKASTYAWQREFRFSFCVKSEALNSKGAYEMQIGSIHDISCILPLKALVEKPLRIKRRTFVLPSPKD